MGMVDWLINYDLGWIGVIMILCLGLITGLLWKKIQNI